MFRLGFFPQSGHAKSINHHDWDLPTTTLFQRREKFIWIWQILGSNPDHLGSGPRAFTGLVIREIAATSSLHRRRCGRAGQASSWTARRRRTSSPAAAARSKWRRRRWRRTCPMTTTSAAEQRPSGSGNNQQKCGWKQEPIMSTSLKLKTPRTLVLILYTSSYWIGCISRCRAFVPRHLAPFTLGVKFPNLMFQLMKPFRKLIRVAFPTRLHHTN